MWLLKSEQGTLFHIVAGKEHTVGRKDGSLVLSDDQSISRLHAKFSLVSDSPNSEDGIKLIDLGSKYGTYINEGINQNTKIAVNECKVLRHSETVRFGLQWHKYTVINIRLSVVISTLNEQDIAVVKNSLIELNGECSRVWSNDCTHFVMSAVKVSVKTVCALATGKHIVTPAYFQMLRDTINSKSANLPNPNDFVPDSAETVLNSSNVSFLPDPRRSTLFGSLTFVVTTPRQMSRLSDMIKSAGGRAVLFSECHLTKKEMCERNILLMQNSVTIKNDSEMSLIPDDYPQFAKYLSSQGYRCIPESDIGLSMVYCSIEKFCNPKHNLLSSLVEAGKDSNSPSPLPVIVPETQIASQDEGPSSVGKIINETIPTPPTPRLSRKRSRGSSIGDEDEGTLKSICGENQNKVRLTPKNSLTSSQKQNDNEENVLNVALKATSLKQCRDEVKNTSSPSTSKGRALRNRSLKEMFASKCKTSLKIVEESSEIEQKSQIIIEESNDLNEDVVCIEESQEDYVEESQSFSFSNYAKSTADKTKASVRTSVDMFDCSGTSKVDHKFDRPNPPKEADKKKDEPASSRSISNSKIVTPSRSLDMFRCSTAIASTSAASSAMSSSSTSKPVQKRKVEKKSSDDFDFSDEDEPKQKLNNTTSSGRSPDLFSATTEAKPDDNDDFDFPEEDQSKRTIRSNTNDNSFNTSKSNHSSTSFIRKSKHKRDDFDFPDEESPLRPKRICQSSIFSGNLFSVTKKVNIKKEKTDDESLDSDFDHHNSKNGTKDKICLSRFIDRQKKMDFKAEGHQLENDFKIKDEPDDGYSDDSSGEEITSNYSANVMIVPMIAKFNGMNMNEVSRIDCNSNEINYKRFKKNRVAGSKQLPKIIKVSFIADEDQKVEHFQAPSSESEVSDHDFDFGEIKKKKVVKRRR